MSGSYKVYEVGFYQYNVEITYVDKFTGNTCYCNVDVDSESLGSFLRLLDMEGLTDKTEEEFKGENN